MGFLSLKKLIRIVNGALPFTLASAMLILALDGRGAHSGFDAALVIAVIFFVSVITQAVVYEYKVFRPKNDFDKYVIGRNFGGVSRKSLLFEKGFSALEGNLFNEALNYFKRSEELCRKEEEKAVISYYQGRCYQLMGYPSNAAKYYRQAVELGADNDDAYVRAGRCFTYTGCFTEAEECYIQLLEKDTYLDYILTDLGLAYLKSGEPKKALSAFMRSVDEGKNYSFALGGCALACLQMKDIERSREYYSKALINNMSDIQGFKTYYCAIAESVGCLDRIDPNMKSAGELSLKN